MTLEETKTALAGFLERNPGVTVEEEAATGRISIHKMWNDESLYITIPNSGYEALFEALNNLLFPERFTAIWHADSKDFEIIYTAFALTGTQLDMKGRCFSLWFKEKEYRCEFAASSGRLVQVAGVAVFAGPSTTEHRNLQSFQLYSLTQRQDIEALKGLHLEPISFWIRNLEWEEELALLLARHLNFYMSYYDTFSPKIELHPPKQESDYAPRERYIAGRFPTDIRATELNSNLLHFWVASRGGDIFRRFLYCYQIIEFSSFYFIEENIRRSVRRALATPHFKDEIDALIIKIIDHVQESKVWEGTKMDALLGEVSCELVWKEVEKNKEYFSKTLEFDGGFILQPLISDKATFDTFRHGWSTKFNAVIRSIRNALSHGKEPAKGAVIAPTHENLAQLQPWAALMSVVAGEVIVYQDNII